MVSYYCFPCDGLMWFSMLFLIDFGITMKLNILHFWMNEIPLFNDFLFLGFCFLRVIKVLVDGFLFIELIMVELAIMKSICYDIMLFCCFSIWENDNETILFDLLVYVHIKVKFMARFEFVHINVILLLWSMNLLLIIFLIRLNFH